MGSTGQLSRPPNCSILSPKERIERTQDANQVSTDNETGSCPTESDDLEGIDISFQLLVVGHGPATIRWMRSFALSTPENLSGDPNACIDEIPFNTVRFDGAGAKNSDVLVATEELAVKDLQYFTAVKTEIVTYQNVSAVGIGTAQSIISQAAADRVARIVATKQAEKEIELTLPPIISLGEGFDD